MVIYFSATGNTAMIARLLAKELDDDDLLEMESDMLLHPEAVTLSPVGKTIVWAFPTYSWGVPPVVLHVIRNIKIDANALKARHYMLTSCGDDMGYADRQWRKELKRRNLLPVAAYAVEMPNTYVCMKGFDVDDTLLEHRKLEGATGSISRIADAVRCDRGDILLRKSFSWVKTYVIYPWFIRHAMSARPFHTSDECNGCGKCAESCPMKNIQMIDKHPAWEENCAMCLRCYHICPKHAVCYGKETVGKGQYKTGFKNL